MLTFHLFQMGLNVKETTKEKSHFLIPSLQVKYLRSLDESTLHRKSFNLKSFNAFVGF